MRHGLKGGRGTLDMTKYREYFGLKPDSVEGECC